MGTECSYCLGIGVKPAEKVLMADIIEDKWAQAHAAIWNYEGSPQGEGKGVGGTSGNRRGTSRGGAYNRKPQPDLSSCP